MAKVSVIIPVYNAEKYLAECMESLINQTLEDLEIIAVDDGSTDRSYPMLCKYAQTDHRIHVYKNKRKGVGAARNTGFAYTSGEYIGFVDSDDYVDTAMYEKLYQKAAENHADIAIGGISLVFMDSGKTESFRSHELYEKYAAYPWFNAKRFPEIIQNIGIWDRIYKREFLIRNKILNIEQISFEDHFYSVQSTVLAERICVVNEDFYNYRKNAGTSITDQEKKNDKYKLDIFTQKRICKKFLRKEMVYPIYREAFLFHQFNEMIYHLAFTTSFSAFRNIFESLRKDTSGEDYRYLKTVEYGDIYVFAGYLQKNQLLRCYCWCKSRKRSF